MSGKDFADTPLGSDELEKLLNDGGRSLYKDQKALAIFIRRVVLTVKLYRQQLRKLNSDMSSLREEVSSGGRATSLNPLDAVRFLAPEQLLGLVDSHMQSRVKATEAAWRDALEAQERNKIFVLKVSAMLRSLDVSTLEPALRSRVDLILSELESLPVSKPPAWVEDNGDSRGSRVFDKDNSKGEVKGAGGLDDLFG